MYAVIESGGKQYRVELGTELAVDRLDAQPGETIEFARVLLVADGDEAAIGRPTVDGARVTADVVRQDRGDKIVVFKYRPKARSRVKQGHRADLTILRVADIELGRKSARKLAADARTERERLEAAAADAAAKQAEADRKLAAKLAADADAADASAAGDAKAPAKPKTAAKPKAAAKAEPKAPAKPKTPASRTQAPQPAAKTEARGQEEGRVVEMAHKKAGSSSKNGRDSKGQRLGVKAGDGQLVTSGSIIVRQRGMTFLAGDGTGLGRDYTVFAVRDGRVRFEHQTRDKKRIRVVAEPVAVAPAEAGA